MILLLLITNQLILIIFPFCSYNEAIQEYGLVKLFDSRQTIVDNLFKEINENEQNKLHAFLPACNPCTRKLGHRRKFRPSFNTDRFQNY